jgi:hypothetical protein
MKNFNPTSAVIGALVCAGILSLSWAQLQQAAALEAVAEALRAPEAIRHSGTIGIRHTGAASLNLAGGFNLELGQETERGTKTPIPLQIINK